MRTQKFINSDWFVIEKEYIPFWNLKYAFLHVHITHCLKSGLKVEFSLSGPPNCHQIRWMTMFGTNSNIQCRERESERARRTVSVPGGTTRGTEVTWHILKQDIRSPIEQWKVWARVVIQEKWVSFWTSQASSHSIRFLERKKWGENIPDISTQN
jgi:hypothetical protein